MAASLGEFIYISVQLSRCIPKRELVLTCDTQCLTLDGCTSGVILSIEVDKGSLLLFVCGGLVRDLFSGLFSGLFSALLITRDQRGQRCALLQLRKPLSLFVHLAGIADGPRVEVLDL